MCVPRAHCSYAQPKHLTPCRTGCSESHSKVHHLSHSSRPHSLPVRVPSPRHQRHVAVLPEDGFELRDTAFLALLLPQQHNLQHRTADNRPQYTVRQRTHPPTHRALCAVHADNRGRCRDAAVVQEQQLTALQKLRVYEVKLRKAGERKLRR
jgi:hypothetical protein